MKFIYIIILVIIFICLLLASVVNGQAATNEIPWRFYQLYSGQALVVDCDANEMSIVPQSDLSVLILCGTSSKYK